jgi:small subunit ribosomal protein S17
MTGIITSNKMTKAVIVTVYTTKVHPKYGKRYKTRKKYTVACSDSAKFNLGDTVEIKSSRPISKTIRFTVVE